MHADILGNILQHHRLDVLDTFVEKFLLAMNNRLDNFVNGLAPVLDVAKQVNC